MELLLSCFFKEKAYLCLRSTCFFQKTLKLVICTMQIAFFNCHNFEGIKLVHVYTLRQSFATRTDRYSEPCQTCKMKRVVKIVNGFPKTVIG